jgi:hypothetical protein
VRELAEIPGVSLVSLQKSEGIDQLAGDALGFPIVDFGDELDREVPFADTAAIIASLDLIVSCDTAIAHLAGAMGRPVWLAHAFAPDWRWLTDRTRSPWYPHHRLFRQTAPGDWKSVFARMAEALRRVRAGEGDVLLGDHAPFHFPRPLCVDVSAGELLDKLSILDIKAARISDAAKLQNVLREQLTLRGAIQERFGHLTQWQPLMADLRQVNEALWEIEDAIREHEARGDFGDSFIALARAVYHENDRRAALKRRLNDLLGSRLVEEKSYADYSRPAPQGGGS